MMAFSASDAIRRLAGADPLFDVLHQQVMAEWAPEVPPTTILFGSYGRRFARSVIEDDANFAALALVEDLLQNGTEEVKNALATGFWEAILAESSKGALDFRLLRPHMGTASITYCKAWDAFTGVHTPGLYDEAHKPSSAT